jgi:hypothetical protein
MLMKLFKRATAVPDAIAINPQDADSTGILKERRRIPRPLPTPQMIEGDGGETDWALWLAATETPEHESALSIQNNKCG